MRRKDEDKERRIKEAVIRLILEQGFEGASMAKIAKEAGVSPSTAYVYYENKEQMLASIYQEYSVNVYEYLTRQVHCGMEGAELVSSLMRGYYTYISENYEIFRFIEQCACCPTLCSLEEEVEEKEQDICCTFSLFESLKEKGILKNYSYESMALVMFSPVKSLAMEYQDKKQAEKLLEEVIRIIQEAILQ